MERRRLKLLNTRAVHQAAPLRTVLEESGAESVDLPLIRIEAEEVHLPELKESDWLVFTSVNTVEFWHRLSVNKPKARIACVGPKTAACAESKGYTVDLVPKRFDAEALAEALIKTVRREDRIVYPRSRRARPALKHLLEEDGRIVEDIVLYDTVPDPDAQERLVPLLEQVDGVLFLSPSAVHAFFEAAPADLPENLFFGSIGSITEKAIRKYTDREVITPETYTIEALVTTIIKKKVTV